MNLRETRQKYAELNPNGFMIAGDHTFECKCDHCMSFLMDGIDMQLCSDDAFPPDPDDVERWRMLQETEMDLISVDEIHALASKLL